MLKAFYETELFYVDESLFFDSVGIPALRDKRCCGEVISLQTFHNPNFDKLKKDDIAPSKTVEKFQSTKSWVQ